MRNERGEQSPEDFKRAGHFESVGIWAGYRLLQYLESLGQIPEKSTSRRLHPFKLRPFVTAFKKGLTPGNLVAAGQIAVLFGVPALLGYGLWNFYQYNKLHPQFISVRGISTPFIPPSAGVGPEQTRPKVLESKLLGKGQFVTYPYGIIVNETEGLLIRVWPAKLQQVLEQVKLVPPDSKILITILTEDSSRAAANIPVSTVSIYEREQDKVYNGSVIALLPFSEAKGTNSGSDLSPFAAEVNLSKAWLKQVKEQVALLQVSQNPQITPPGTNRTENELLIAVGTLPFRVLSFP